MTKSIKLMANDFGYIHWDKDSGGPELFELIIYGKSRYDCDKIKEQILDNQKIVDGVVKSYKSLVKDGAFNEVHEVEYSIAQELENIIKESTGKDIKDLS